MTLSHVFNKTPQTWMWKIQEHNTQLPHSILKLGIVITHMIHENSFYLYCLICRHCRLTFLLLIDCFTYQILQISWSWFVQQVLYNDSIKNFFFYQNIDTKNNTWLIISSNIFKLMNHTTVWSCLPCNYVIEPSLIFQRVTKSQIVETRKNKMLLVQDSIIDFWIWVLTLNLNQIEFYINNIT